MKKIIIALAAVAALASCAKSEVEFTPDQQEIGLTPLTENRTKAMVATTDFPKENFAVWAFYKQLPAGTTIAAWQSSTLAQQTYIDEKPFETLYTGEEYVKISCEGNYAFPEFLKMWEGFIIQYDIKEVTTSKTVKNDLVA